jgi:hypothetical protein
MAQQTRSRSSRSSNGSRSTATQRSRKGRAATRPSARARSSQNGSSSRRSRATAPTRRGRSSSPGNSGPIAAAKETTVDGAKTVGNAVSSTAKQFKTPAIAAGVGLAGLAGGIALGRGKGKNSPHLLPLPGSGGRSTSEKLSKAVKNVGAAAEQTGQIAERVRRVSEAVGGDQPAPRRSPIEVVLEGLTRRSASAAPRS